MLVIKLDKKDIKDDATKKIFSKNLFSYIKDLFNQEKINIIDDSKSLELVTSNLDEKTEKTTIELVYKKTITINNEDIKDKQSLDKVISEIKNFCDQTIQINNYVYLPLNMREKNNANTRTSTSGDSIERRP
jgi:hypothetical protein